MVLAAAMSPAADLSVASMPRLDETPSPLASDSVMMRSAGQSAQVPKQKPTRAPQSTDVRAREAPSSAHASQTYHPGAHGRQQDSAAHAKLPVLGAASVSGSGKRLAPGHAPRHYERPGLQSPAGRDGVNSASGAAAQSQKLGGAMPLGREATAGVRASPPPQSELATPRRLPKCADRSDFVSTGTAAANGVRVDGNGAGPSQEDPGPSSSTPKEFSAGDKVAALASFDHSYRKLLLL
jgi:hypothetical protein